MVFFSFSFLVPDLKKDIIPKVYEQGSMATTELDVGCYCLLPKVDPTPAIIEKDAHLCQLEHLHFQALKLGTEGHDQILQHVIINVVGVQHTIGDSVHVHVNPEVFF